MQTTPTKPKKLVSLLELSRQTNVPYSTAARIFFKGNFPADFISNNSFLFFPERAKHFAELVKL
jgi:hypothetical protein